jgi:hypothetical protein
MGRKCTCLREGKTNPVCKSAKVIFGSFIRKLIYQKERDKEEEEFNLKSREVSEFTFNVWRKKFRNIINNYKF